MQPRGAGALEKPSSNATVSAVFGVYCNCTVCFVAEITVIFSTDAIRDIKDPEHDLTLEELGVVEEGKIDDNSTFGVIKLFFTPTVRLSLQRTLSCPTQPKKNISGAALLVVDVNRTVYTR